MLSKTFPCQPARPPAPGPHARTSPRQLILVQPAVLNTLLCLYVYLLHPVNTRYTPTSRRRPLRLSHASQTRISFTIPVWYITCRLGAGEESARGDASRIGSLGQHHDELTTEVDLAE